MPPHPLVALEDALAEELVLASLGAADPPRVDGRYEIVALLGRGARGLVCRAVDLRLDRDVALKLYPPFEDPQWVEELAREGKALARLDHPHVVRVFDVATGALARGASTTPVHYLSMELVVGRSLRALASEADLDRSTRLRLLREVAEALDAAHSVGVVHRDVKPENVVVDARKRARVVDFGLARVGASTATADVPGADPRGTSYGTLVGTPEYMAYEARDGRVGPPADQFALAVMAFELLTGTMPYRDGERPLDAPDAPLPAPDRPLPDGMPRAPFERALARDPAARFPSATAFVTALGTGPTASAARDESRRRAATLGLAAFGAAVAGAAFVASTPGVERRQGVEPARPSSLAPVRDTQPVDSVAGSPTPAVEAPPIDTGRPCAAALGGWDLLATVEQSRLSRVPPGFQSYFRLHLAGDGGCDVLVHVQKLGDDAVAGDAGPLHVDPDMIRDDRARVQLTPRGDALVLEETFALASRTRGRRDYHLALRLVEGAWTGSIGYLGPNGQAVYESTVTSVPTPDAGAFGFSLARDLGLSDPGAAPGERADIPPAEPDAAAAGTSPGNPP